jgi:hypothetical protein
MLIGAAHVKPKINRHDVINDDCPRWLRAHMVRIGGLNIYNEPVFRIVRAEKVFRRISIERPFFNDDQDPTHFSPLFIGAHVSTGSWHKVSAKHLTISVPSSSGHTFQR